MTHTVGSHLAENSATKIVEVEVVIWPFDFDGHGFPVWCDARIQVRGGRQWQRIHFARSVYPHQRPVAVGGGTRGVRQVTAIRQAEVRRAGVSAHHDAVKHFERLASNGAGGDVERHCEELARSRIDDVAGRGIERRRSSCDQRLLLAGLEIPHINARVVITADAVERNRVDERLFARQETRKTMTSFAVLHV